MIPAAFDYHVSSTVGEATALLARLGEDAKVLSGGQSLIPLKQVRVAVKLTNPLDEALVRQGMLTPEQVRTSERDALVDTDAVRMVIPPQVATRLGLGVRGQRMAEYADGRTEAVSVTEPLVVEIDGRDTSRGSPGTR